MQTTPYWLDTAPQFTGSVHEAIDSRADVVIVGGGLTGLSAALELARQGAETIVIEAGSVIGKASGRNGGQCNVGIFHDYGDLSRRLGERQATHFYRAFESAVATVETVIEQEAIDCDFRRCGKLKLAMKPHHFDALQRSFELIHERVDRNLELIPRERLAEEVRSDQFYGGLLQSTSASLHVGRFGVGLANAVVRSGGRIVDDTCVLDVDKRGPDRYRVTTSRGDVECSNVLLATGGAPLGRAFSWFRRRIVPVGSFIIVTELLDEALIDQLLPNRRCYVTTKNIGRYFRVTPDRRLLFGGRAKFTTSNARADVTSGRILQQTMVGIFPELAGTRIDYCWGGDVDMTRDRLPRAGRDASGVRYSMGYSGHGVQMSVHMGMIMARKICGEDAENPWEDLDWPAIPGHFGRAWFLPAVGAYYRAVDCLR